MKQLRSKVGGTLKNAFSFQNPKIQNPKIKRQPINKHLQIPTTPYSIELLRGQRYVPTIRLPC